MADINIDGVVTWLKNWFYDKTEITGFLNNKANQSDLQTTNSNLSNLSSTVDNKVDKVTGKGLSTEDFTTALKDKLDGIEAQANKTVVDSALSSTSTNPLQNKAINSALNGKAAASHAHYIGNSSSDNGSLYIYPNGDGQNPAHLGAWLHALNSNKVDKVTGKGLSTEDFTTTLKNKLDGIESGANNYTHPSTHASSIITEESALSNIGTSANANQHTINAAINTVLGNLVDVKFIEITTDKGTATADKMNKLYIETKNSKTDVYYVVRSGTSPNYTYDWEDLDTDILDNLVVNWSDVQNKPSSFTPSSHTHGQITNDGKITSNGVAVASNDFIVITDTSDSSKLKRTGNLLADHIKDSAAHTNIGSSANDTQATINTNIDTALGNKGALTDDVDWSYSSDGFTNGVKLVDKTTNANGRITLHLKS